jgi:hypothetical protein
MSTNTKIKRPRLALNSEGEAFNPAKGEHLDDWEPVKQNERDLVALWERGMSTFRNWRGRRERGEPFSQVETCWMPSAILDTDGEPVLRLAAEFSAEGCWLAEDRKRDGRPCLPADTVKPALERLLAANRPPAGVGVKLEETDKAYFEIAVTTATPTFDQAVAYVKTLSPLIRADASLSFAHEFIG